MAAIFRPDIWKHNASSYSVHKSEYWRLKIRLTVWVRGYTSGIPLVPGA